ncbi:OmpA family protein [Flavobacterium cerinum]|uniref:OmpA family protein n=1 Tax=Flavobacterium cerinum TaxID=2502784 RepID=A0ABY5INX1_9FLAO|nr:OmpA family protein [Flavobacterium cerinum]UUC44500.1 OmpA family protein [Flavobacterium cerinum]
MKSISILLLTFICATGVLAQKARMTKADKKYDQYAYIDAIKVYEKVAEKGYKSANLFENLGNAYYFNGELDKAEKWYGELFALNQTVDPIYYFRYSQSLKSIGQYDKANSMLKTFYQKTNDPAGNELLKDPDYAEKLRTDSGRFQVENSGTNSKYSDYGAAFFNEGVVFASARDTGGVFHRKHKWTNQYFTKLYTAKIGSDGFLEPAEKFSESIDTRFHEATPVFTKDGTTMYFTRNNYNNGKKGKSSDRVVKLKIYKATLVDGKWDNVIEMPFNSNNYSTAHPALSPDEKLLYFSSDMPGSLGNSDIFKVAINSDGTYGKPENLGKTINTSGRETFPFVSLKNDLYFASDGHLGIGGLDIFKSKIRNDGYSTPENLGSPVNSPKDDFALILDSQQQMGYFSSNRDGGQGSDDIYKFRELRCEQLLKGVITDKESGLPLPNAKVSLFDANMNPVGTMQADSGGNYRFENIDCDKNYYVRAEYDGYQTQEVSVMIPAKSGETTRNIALEKKVIPIEPGIDLAKVLDIEIIYFDLDKWNIRPDAEIELQKVITVMKEHPTITVDIRSHTDSRQTHKYNERLSDRRAKSTLEYMVKHGIDRSRLTAKGYGETQLVNRCSDGVKCSEAEHQQNRRSEFIVVKM